MIVFLAILIGFLTGSIPSAYLLIKHLYGFDITSSGSGNVGAMNSYETTGKRYVGVVVFLADVAKGAAAVLLTSLIPGVEYFHLGLAGLWAVIGHNFSIFMAFKGGRGLAAAVGVFAVLNPLPIILWCILWLTGYYVIRRNVHVANAIASVGLPIMAFSTPDKLLDLFSVIPIESHLQFKLIISAICIVILIRHIKPLKELFNSDENNS
jgi:glycerol-3-phosphate acyltransferase PlsY